MTSIETAIYELLDGASIRETLDGFLSEGEGPALAEDITRAVTCVKSEAPECFYRQTEGNTKVCRHSTVIQGKKVKPGMYGCPAPVKRTDKYRVLQRGR